MLMMKILRSVSMADRGVGVAALVTSCGRSPASISRSLRRLSHLGAVELYQGALGRLFNKRFYVKRVAITTAGRDLLAADSFSGREEINRRLTAAATRDALIRQSPDQARDMRPPENVSCPWA
jgi:hypothetical protein